VTTCKSEKPFLTAMLSKNVKNAAAFPQRIKSSIVLKIQPFFSGFLFSWRKNWKAIAQFEDPASLFLELRSQTVFSISYGLKSYPKEVQGRPQVLRRAKRYSPGFSSSSPAAFIWIR